MMVNIPAPYGKVSSMLDINHEITELVSLGIEGDYWDFKKEWHNNNADLLHDIICMANNLANRDAYIIIGVKNGEVFGVPSANRKNQQNLIDFLNIQQFAGSIRPTIYVSSLMIMGKEVHVIIIKSTAKTPYYLTADYNCHKNEKSNCVKSGHIYTRIGDTNTPKTETAAIDKVEYLWKKRFGLDLTPLEKVKYLLKTPKEWLPIGTDGVHTSNNHNFIGSFFNRQYPEFTIQYKEDTSRFDKGRIDVVEQSIYWMNKLPCPLHNAYIYELSINYHSTVMYSTLAVFADGFRFKRIHWKNEILFQNESDIDILYAFIEKDSLDFLLDDWLCNNYETVRQIEEYNFYSSLEPWKLHCEYSSNNPYSVVPVFENVAEHGAFLEHVKSHKTEFLEVVGDYDFHKSTYTESGYIMAAYPDFIDYLCKTGETLFRWLNEWRIKGRPRQ